MPQDVKELKFSNFSTGLNTTDSSHDFADSDLVIADNVNFKETGQVESWDAPLQIGNKIKVNSITATKLLGGKVFNSSQYIMASNGTNARLVKKYTFTGSITTYASGGSGLTTVTSNAHGLFDGDSVTIAGTTNYNGTYTISAKTTNTFKITLAYTSNDATGTFSSLGWKEVVSQNFDPDALCDMIIYSNKLWIVNGQTTNSNILNFISTSDVLTGLTTSCGLPAGIDRLELHLERVWISYLNSLYVSIQYPTAANSDWDASRVYSGSEAPGLIQIDNNTEDTIQRLVSYFGSLVVFRKKSIHVVNGQTILSSTIQKSFNSKGFACPFSLGIADSAIYFLSETAVKQFQGISTKDQATQFDNISSQGIDRKIRSEISLSSNKTNWVGYAFQDRYYLSDKSTKILIFNEITNGWSTFTNSPAQLFIEEAGILYFGYNDAVYQFNGSTTASITSHIKTKDFNLGTDQFYKVVEKLTILLSRLSASSTITLEWYLNGASNPSGTKSITVNGNKAQWDAGYTWDSGIKWDSTVINFLQDKQRWIGSCLTIAFGIKATGANRFSLSSLDLIFDQIRKES